MKKKYKNHWERNITESLNNDGIFPSYVCAVEDIGNPLYDMIKIGIRCNVECGKEWALALLKSVYRVVNRDIKNTFDQDGRKVFGGIGHDRLKKYECFDGNTRYITEIRVQIRKGF